MSGRADARFATLGCSASVNLAGHGYEQPKQLIPAAGWQPSL